MGIFDNNLKEMLGSQMVSVIGGIISGTILAVYADKLLLIPGMLIMLPGFLEMRGNISGSFSSRISSGLFLHVIKPKFKKTHLIKGNVIAALLLAVIVSLFLGLVTFGFNYIFMGIFLPKIILVPLAAGILANLIEVPLSLFATLYLYRKGHDPNNIMGPFVTSTGDISSIVSLLIAMVMLW